MPLPNDTKIAMTKETLTLLLESAYNEGFSDRHELSDAQVSDKHKSIENNWNYSYTCRGIEQHCEDLQAIFELAIEKRYNDGMVDLIHSQL